MPAKSSISSPDGALSFLFGIFALLMWFMSSFSSHATATLLSVGITWMILSTGTLTASFINMFRGSEKGNVNLLASILLGFFPGINTLAVVFSSQLGWTYTTGIYGLMYLAGAVFGFGVCWRRRHYPAYIFIRTLTMSFGLLFLAVGDLMNDSLALKVGGWNLFVFALLSFYYGLSKMYPLYGGYLWQGPALFPERAPAQENEILPAADAAAANVEKTANVGEEKMQ